MSCRALLHVNKHHKKGYLLLQWELCEDKLLQVMSLNPVNNPSMYKKTAHNYSKYGSKEGSGSVNCDGCFKVHIFNDNHFHHVPRSQLLPRGALSEVKEMMDKTIKIRSKLILKQKLSF